MAKISLAQKIARLFGLYKNKNEDFFDELTDTLIEGDIGAKTAFEITEMLEKKCKEKHIADEKAIKAELKELLLSFVKAVELQPRKEDTSVYMFLGVNGAGKTTSAAKLARYYTNAGHSVVLAAADTYRAAAIEQLSYHGEKLGVRVVSHQHGADPSAVVFDAASAVSAKGGGLVIADTAGRLHNKENLVRELQKIDRIAAQKASEGAYKKLIVLDATTGQNAMRQAEVFHEAVGVDAAVLTKYDSTAKGGIAVSLGRELGIPVAFVCTGEKYDDIELFSPEKYVDEFLEG
ncbi:MAG: signal recognition particle-docking protein FtsY [Treponemataceae bacterium]|jgi:fused signal recognition particle receptor|nr:signal recognition particle-docking protein FtsY [Treponemataceae bacterium]